MALTSCRVPMIVPSRDLPNCPEHFPATTTGGGGKIAAARIPEPRTMEIWPARFHECPPLSDCENDCRPAPSSWCHRDRRARPLAERPGIDAHRRPGSDVHGIDVESGRLVACMNFHRSRNDDLALLRTKRHNRAATWCRIEQLDLSRGTLACDHNVWVN